MISKGRGGRRYLPYTFTEHGAIMAANVLNSEPAVEMSVFFVRAFVKLRETLSESARSARQHKARGVSPGNKERKIIKPAARATEFTISISPRIFHFVSRD